MSVQKIASSFCNRMARLREMDKYVDLCVLPQLVGYMKSSAGRRDTKEHAEYFFKSLDCILSSIEEMHASRVATSAKKGGGRGTIEALSEAAAVVPASATETASTGNPR